MIMRKKTNKCTHASNTDTGNIVIFVATLIAIEDENRYIGK